MARRRTKAAAPVSDFVPSAFLYRCPFISRDRFSVADGALELVHPPRMSHASTELAISWLELIITKLRANASDEIEQCSVEECTAAAKLWEREPQLRGFCKQHAPDPHHLMGGEEYEARRWR